MATYVVPANWADQGERDVASSPKRLDVARQQRDRIGGRLHNARMTMRD